MDLGKHAAAHSLQTYAFATLLAVILPTLVLAAVPIQRHDRFAVQAAIEALQNDSHRIVAEYALELADADT